MVDEIIAPSVQAQQIGYTMSGDANGSPPTFEGALDSFDAWLEGIEDDGLTVEQREYRKAMGI